MLKKKILFEDNFNKHKIGPIDYDYTPIGEYHYYKNRIKKNGWIEPSNRGWRLGGHWIIIENEKELLDIINSNINSEMISENAKKLLVPHLEVIW